MGTTVRKGFDRRAGRGAGVGVGFGVGVGVEAVSGFGARAGLAKG